MAIDQWARALYGINPEIINKAIDKAANEMTYIPTLAEFKSLCTGIKPDVDIEECIRNLSSCWGWTKESAREHYRKMGYDC